ncbi:MAG: helix-turn-helix domain-containing protein [Erysipelotrichaceae bacterium]
MLHQNLKQTREQKGYSQAYVSEQLHIVRQTLSKWEQGKSVPDAMMLEQIAMFYEVDVRTLLSTTPQLSEQSNEEALVQQLANLNEQLANSQRQRKNGFKLVITILLGLVVCFFVIPLILSFFFMIA